MQHKLQTESWKSTININWITSHSQVIQNLNSYQEVQKTKSQIIKSIYKITSEFCKRRYLGQSRRKILKRYEDHCRHVKYNRPNKSAVAFHAIKELHLNFNPKDAHCLKPMKPINDYYKLDAWESLITRKNKTIDPDLLNIDPSPICSPLFNLT